MKKKHGFKLVRINEQLAERMQQKLDHQRKVSGIFKSAVTYVNELVATDLASQDSPDSNESVSPI